MSITGGVGAYRHRPNVLVLASRPPSGSPLRRIPSRREIHALAGFRASRNDNLLSFETLCLFYVILRVK